MPDYFISYKPSNVDKVISVVDIKIGKISVPKLTTGFITPLHAVLPCSINF